MLSEGNINLNDRPIVRNTDGSQSTEYSTSFGDQYGHEILAPTIVNGRFLTPSGTMPQEGTPQYNDMLRNAQGHFEQTGENMGIFRDVPSEEAYAQRVHERTMQTSNPWRTVRNIGRK